MKRFAIMFLTLTLLIVMTPFYPSKAVGVTQPSLPLEGYIKEINTKESWVVVEEYNGSIQQWSLTQNTVFMIDNTPADLTDFKPGMEIYAKYTKNNITYIESWSTENPGYIPPGTKVQAGTIKKIDRDQLIIRYLTGKEETFFTSPATIAVKNGVNVPLSTLYEGDQFAFTLMKRLYYCQPD